MDSRDDTLFETYRPFRNKLANYNLIDSLFVIWGYSRNYTFNKEFPSIIEKPFDFDPNDPDIFNRKSRGIYEHELEFLQKEFILNCDIGRTKHSLKVQNNLKNTVNYLRGPLENALNKYTNTDNILLEFNRLAHRQFKWQVNYDRPTIFRYYQIYSDPTLSQVILDKFKLTTQQLFLISFLVLSSTVEHFRTPFPIRSELKVITNEMIEIFFSHFSTTINDARRELKKHQQINENFYHTFNPLLDRPILLDNSSFLCPIPLFIFWKMTSGIYYSIVKEKNFDEAFGTSFQKYVGEVLDKSCTSKNIKVLPEEKYGKPEKGTADWIVIDLNSIMFIECKTKRMRLDSKSALEITQSLEADLIKMASFIGQLYKTYIDYEANLYPHLKFEEAKDFYPLVLTLEDWYITFNHLLQDKLKNLVLDYFSLNKIDLRLLEKFPYHIRCAAEFEQHIQLINVLGLKEYFHKTENNLIQDFISTFEYIDIYEGQFQKVFLDPLSAG